MVQKWGYVYILTNQRNGTLYIWVTSDLERRVMEHKSKTIPGFTQKYELDTLVYIETFPTMLEAIQAEKKLKWLTRIKKIALIEWTNENWNDLSEKWFE